eukprot:SAG31_NODE_3957_length_3718_cov_2.819563_1_plen_136_part_00
MVVSLSTADLYRNAGPACCRWTLILMLTIDNAPRHGVALWRCKAFLVDSRHTNHLIIHDIHACNSSPRSVAPLLPRLATSVVVTKRYKPVTVADILWWFDQNKLLSLTGPLEHCRWKVTTVSFALLEVGMISPSW